MNWYSITKLSSPMIEKPDVYNRYYDFGHDRQSSGIILWFLDRNYNFHTIENPKEMHGHLNWKEYSQSNVLVQGRYDPNKHTTSMYFGFLEQFPEFRNISFYREEKIKERFESMVDKKFNNPTIIPFKI